MYSEHGHLHDRAVRPLMHKRAEECRFFAQEKCIRGAACTFAHGPEEMQMILQLKEETEKAKRFRGEGMHGHLQAGGDSRLRHLGVAWQGSASRPGDWRCPGCQDLQFARNTVCRRCGAPKPFDAPY
eukprot:TRINITY_DN15962_c0_g2_i3.p1 TRINITY_DN15962_c0_g2~~TRINITY_DN15962_c0_g2_i3.p1  ORF type:complete len:127 (+),score=16.67 TRINITY_DN15962_c0_g2_i3:268-648(+)